MYLFASILKDIGKQTISKISHNSCSPFSTDAFAYFHKKAENRINVTSDNADVYHGPYSEEELQDALHRAPDT